MNKQTRYTLITTKGKVMVFFVKAVADLYLLIEGGTLVNNIELTAEEVI